METVAAASSAHVYRGRHPERSVLYRALALHFERFLHVYEDRFLPTHGYLRGCVETAVHRYLDCGIFDQGIARVCCPDCRHVHVLVTNGGFTPDGAFRPLAWFHSQHVERLFRAEVLRMLLDKELITEALGANLLSWRHSGFSAHGAVRVEDRKGAARLGRYMIRCPIVLKRLSWHADTGEVFYRSRPTRRGGADGGQARWDVLEFLARVVRPHSGAVPADGALLGLLL